MNLISWYQKINPMNLYQEIDFFYIKNDFLISWIGIDWFLDTLFPEIEFSDIKKWIFDIKIDFLISRNTE